MSQGFRCAIQSEYLLRSQWICGSDLSNPIIALQTQIQETQDLEDMETHQQVQNNMYHHVTFPQTETMCI